MSNKLIKNKGVLIFSTFIFVLIAIGILGIIYLQQEPFTTSDFDSDLNYDDVPSLRIEARQKLKKIRPENIGQASRISGVSPADISVLLVYLKQN